MSHIKITPELLADIEAKAKKAIYLYPNRAVLAMIERIRQLEAANETLESDYYAVKRKLACRDGQIAKMRNQLDDIQNRHEGVGMSLGIGQQMQLNNTMKSLSVSRNGLGPFLCALDGDGLTILFRVNKIAGPLADNPLHNKGGAE